MCSLRLSQLGARLACGLSYALKTLVCPGPLDSSSRGPSANCSRLSPCLSSSILLLQHHYKIFVLHASCLMLTCLPILPCPHFLRRILEAHRPAPLLPPNPPSQAHASPSSLHAARRSSSPPSHVISPRLLEVWMSWPARLLAGCLALLPPRSPPMLLAALNCTCSSSSPSCPSPPPA